MKEAIANAGVFNLIIIFVIILLAFFIGSLGYTKAFKVKNRIVDEIEKNEGYDAQVQETIENDLKEIGYRMNTNSSRTNCPQEEFNDIKANAINTKVNSNYQYCVYEFNTCGGNQEKPKCTVHYRVVAYMYFDVPVISSLIKIPVKGETVSFTTINS